MASPRGDPSASTPICRCRVLYLGSAVPHVTKDGLQGIQEPLRELYPEQGALGARGIDSWLSVWSNGLLLENVDENHKKVTRFFPIDTLHYCAAVRYVLVPEKATAGGGGGGGGGPATPRFLPLDSPFARSPNPSHPPLFAAILRRTTGIKVLECHAFICKREMAANALVRCCFHAYADSSYARHIDGGGGGNASIYGTLRSQANGGGGGGADGSLMHHNPIAKVEGWRRMAGDAGERGSTLTLNSHIHRPHTNNGTLKSNATNHSGGDDVSIYNGDENHKVWAGTGTIERGASLGEETYGSSNTLKSRRMARPRQVVAPVGAPPPPPPAKDADAAAKAAKKAGKDKARRKKMMGGSREELYPLMNGSLMRGATMYGHPHAHGHGRSASSMSGTLMRGQHHYANGGGGTLMRPASAHQMNGYHHPHPPPHPHQHPHAHPHPHAHAHPHPHPHPPPPVLLVPHPAATLPSGRSHNKKMGTFSRPGSAKGGAVLLQPPPAPFVPVMPGPPPPAGPIMLPVPVMPTGTGKKNKHHPAVPPEVAPVPPAAAAAMVHSVAIEEPIYMPSTRPMSPVASFQPGHFPHEAYLLQQYATMDSKHRKKLTKHDRKAASTMMLNGIGHGDDEDEEAGPNGTNVEESPFNTGIYRKKGHLNERAFSYSIRQEHRSRSYGSLASLKFSTPIPNGGGDPTKEDIKKEREIMQMMHDLELSGDELERSEVPPAVYESRRAAAAAAAAQSKEAVQAKSAAVVMAAMAAEAARGSRR